jgi:hypothetical protein
VTPRIEGPREDEGPFVAPPQETLKRGSVVEETVEIMDVAVLSPVQVDRGFRESQLRAIEYTGLVHVIPYKHTLIDTHELLGPKLSDRVTKEVWVDRIPGPTVASIELPRRLSYGQTVKGFVQTPLRIDFDVRIHNDDQFSPIRH